MPGKIGPSCPSFAIKLSRSSSFTRRERNFSSEKGLRRNSPRVRGKLIAAQLQKLSAISRQRERRNVVIIRRARVDVGLVQMAVSSSATFSDRVSLQDGQNALEE